MNDIYDMVIIGAGPAGLTAGIYGARARFKVLILEQGEIGGQITITNEVVNFPGVLETSGKELTQTMKEQAIRFGAEIKSAKVTEVDFSQEIRIIKTEKGEIKTFGAILATGASPRSLGFPGEEEFKGRGIAYCATCDGEFFTGMDVFVVGAGFAAAEEAVFLTKYAKKVTIIAREPQFTCAEGVAEKALNHDKIEVKFHTEVVSVTGDSLLRSAKFVNNETGEEWEYKPEGENETFGMFIFVGYQPASKIFKEQIKLNSSGYIITDKNCKTNMDGIYAAGDICEKELRQVVTAVSDGATAATSLEKYVEELHGKYKIERKHNQPEISKKPETARNPNASGQFISNEILQQLQPVLEKFENTVEVVGFLGDSPLANEIAGFLQELSSVSEKIKVSYEDKHQNIKEHINLYPSIVLLDAKGNYSGIQFHGVPGGHEFNSFIIALYNVAGPGQSLDEDVKQKIKKVSHPVNIKVAVSLSCTLCPEVVMGTQRVAQLNEKIEAEMIDIGHFPELKKKLNIMSVPCMIVNDEDIYFGKKDLRQIIDIIVES